MNRCSSGKRTYETQEVAENVLVESWVRYEYSGQTGPVSIYKCEDCGHYHLTSKGPMNARLAEALKDGSIEKQKQGRRWEDKLRRR